MGKCNDNGEKYGCSPGQISNIVLLVCSVALFIYLILKDGVKSLKSKAHWIPGDFLVLSALTIQLLNLISTQGQPLNLEMSLDIPLIEFWMIHTSRIMLCVVIAYLVPAMANPGAEDFWGKITSLAITVFLHVITELYILVPSTSNPTDSYLSRLWPKQKGTSHKLYYILAAVILSSFLMLVCLLACANIAGRGIERIVAHKIPLILKAQVLQEEHHDHRQHDRGYGRGSTAEETEEDHSYDSGCKSCWERVEKKALRAWIIARAYSLEYIIARSVLASSAAIILTSQITITIIAGVWKTAKLEVPSVRDGVMVSITMMQCVFILTGWPLVLRRWITAVAYYGTWSSCFRIEDFWTRHLKDLQQKEDHEVQQYQLLKAKIDKLAANQPSKISLPGLALYGVIALQLYTVSLSKACLFWSLMLFRNAFTNRLLSIVLAARMKDYDKPEQKAMLDGVGMLGETSDSLWLSNRTSIPTAVGLFSQGEKDGEQNCKTLVEFVRTMRSGRGLGLGCFEPSKRHSGLTYVCTRGEIEGGEGWEKEHFRDGMSRKAWKITAVALLRIILQLYPVSAETHDDTDRPSTSDSTPPKVAGDCIKAYSEAWEFMDFIEDATAYSEAWEFMDFIEDADPQADRIDSQAADKNFRILESSANLSHKSTEGSGSKSSNVTLALGELKSECKSEIQKAAGSKNAGGPKNKKKSEGNPNGWNGNDSMDWKAEAWASCVYELCNSIECNEGTDAKKLLKELEMCLADIMNECLQKIQQIVLVNCRKWAVKSDERRIVKAIYTAGKASVVLEKLKSRREGPEN